MHFQNKFNNELGTYSCYNSFIKDRNKMIFFNTLNEWIVCGRAYTFRHILVSALIKRSFALSLQTRRKFSVDDGFEHSEMVVGM